MKKLEKDAYDESDEDKNPYASEVKLFISSGNFSCTDWSKNRRRRRKRKNHRKYPRALLSNPQSQDQIRVLFLRGLDLVPKPRHQANPLPRQTRSKILALLQLHL